MKKIFFAILLTLFLPLAFASANVDDDTWSYFFHLQYKQGVLAIEEGASQPYTSVPELYTEKTDPATTDFYGTVVSIKGREEARFGFNKPTNIITAQGKSVFTVKAPFFADADHVTFYARGGKNLFTVSTQSSSFCNDNNKCNSDIGENYLNCPMDCPAPPNPPTPPTTVTTPPAVTPSTQTGTTTTQPSVTSPQKNPGATGITTQENGTNSTTTPNKKFVIMLIVGGILCLILAIVMWRVRKTLD